MSNLGSGDLNDREIYRRAEQNLKGLIPAGKTLKDVSLSAEDRQALRTAVENVNCFGLINLDAEYGRLIERYGESIVIGGDQRVGLITIPVSWDYNELGLQIEGEIVAAQIVNAASSLVPDGHLLPALTFLVDRVSTPQGEVTLTQNKFAEIRDIITPTKSLPVMART